MYVSVIISLLLIDLFLVKANQGGPDTINYKDHKYCQMGVAASFLKVSYNSLVRVELWNRVVW